MTNPLPGLCDKTPLSTVPAEKPPAARAVRIYPVIHHLSRELSLEQARLAQRCGSNGVFLISHLGQDKEVLDVAWELKQMMGSTPFEVGVNLLSTPAVRAIEMAREAGLDMLWADQMGVNSSGLSAEGHACAQQARQGGLRLLPQWPSSTKPGRRTRLKPRARRLQPALFQLPAAKARGTPLSWKKSFECPNSAKASSRWPVA